MVVARCSGRREWVCSFSLGRQETSWREMMVRGAQHYSMPLSSVQSLSRVRLFATPWIATRKASLSITNSLSLPKLMSINSVMPSNHLILCCPLLLLPSIFPSIRVFSMSQFKSGGQIIEASASSSVLPMNIQDWLPLRLTGWIFLQSRGL